MTSSHRQRGPSTTWKGLVAVVALLVVALAGVVGARLLDVGPYRDTGASTSATPAASASPTPTLPAVGGMRAEEIDGRMRIVDETGERFKVSAANWYGAETPDLVPGGLDRRPLADMAEELADAGFNTVRLPWSNEMVRDDEVPDPARVAANPQLQGKTALEVYDAVVEALADADLRIILDNHHSTADWCCNIRDGNGLWYTAEHPESEWLEHWTLMAKRYEDQPAVIAAELRNEIRFDVKTDRMPTWGSGHEETDWKRAATLGVEAVHSVAPRLLVVVGGLEHNSKLIEQFRDPLKIPRQDKLVYAVHDYAWRHSDEALSSQSLFNRRIQTRWGGMNDARNDFAAPVLLTEWGACIRHDASETDCDPSRAKFLTRMASNLETTDIGFAWWAFNGTQSSGYTRTRGKDETYGLADTQWRLSFDALPSELQGLLR